MANLNEVNDALAIAYGLDILDDEEFALLHEEHGSKNLEIPYWQYKKFNFDRMNNDKCKAEFRFNKREIFELIDFFSITR